MRATASASVWIKAPKTTVHQVLTGYGRYRAWMPDVTRSRRLAQEGGIAIVELVVPLFGSQKILLESVETPDRLLFTQIDRYREEGLTARWQLREPAGGEGVVVEAGLEIRQRLVPLGCGRRLGGVLDRTLSALGDRARRIAASGAGEAGTSRRKVLEITRRDGALVVELGDETWKLSRVGGTEEKDP